MRKGNINLGIGKICICIYECKVVRGEQRRGRSEGKREEGGSKEDRGLLDEGRGM